MNEEKSSEIHRRFRPEKNAITNIHGCYVNQNEEIISIILNQSRELCERKRNRFFCSRWQEYLGKDVQ
ncbi:DUF4317 family protein [Faecalispora jeddahensis]|uniref:DUF4317 family protein n=1 Tax=Faecalispora jeddahensis TaxID=1414721 RepID=UPI0028A6EE47|nr:DUF4317 family protein [Faecalispora jeddahensis]